MKLIYFAALLVTLCSSGGCQDKNPRDTVLGMGFNSGISVSEVSRDPRISSLEFKVLEEKIIDENSQRPKFEFTKLRISGIKDGVHEGNLELSFFNNRLFKTDFYPSNYDAYIARLKKSEFPIIKCCDDRKQLGNLEVRISKNYLGIPYVSWEDIDISESYRHWIRNYA